MAYEDYRDTNSQWVDRIPAHWRIERLKFVARPQASNVDKHSKDDEIPVRLCNYTDVYNNAQITADMDFMEATATQAEIEKFALTDDEVIITKDSESWEDIAVPTHVPKAIEGVLCGYHLTQIRPNQEQLDGRYLYYQLCSAALNRQFQVKANGVTRFGLPAYHIDNAETVVPTIEEQRAIASFLDAKVKRIDSLIERRTQLIPALNEKRRALITRRVTEGLDRRAPTKTTTIPYLRAVPSHWRTDTPLKYLITTFGGSTPSTGEARYWVGGEIPWVSPKDMHVHEIYSSEDSVTEEAVAETALKIIDPNAVLIVVRGMILAHSFPVAITRVPVTVNQDMKALIPCPRLQPEYLAYLLRGLSSYLLSLVETSAHGTKAFRTDVWSRLILPEPPIEEQLEIVSKLDRETAAIDDQIAAINRHVSALQEYRAAVITAAVTGQIKVV